MGAPKPKDVLPLAQEITRLEAQLAEAKRKWNILFGITEPEKRTRANATDGVAENVLNYVLLNRGSELSISDVATATGLAELQAGRALYRLAQSGRIANPSRGRYTALPEPKIESVSENQNGTSVDDYSQSAEISDDDIPF